MAPRAEPSRATHLGWYLARLDELSLDENYVKICGWISKIASQILMPTSVTRYVVLSLKE